MTPRASTSPLPPAPAQLRIITKIAEGLSTEKAAADLGLAVGTISAQMTSARRRVGVRSPYALVHTCYVLGLIPRPDTAPAPGGADPDEVTILWRLALGDSYEEIQWNALMKLDDVEHKLQALRARWGAENDPHLITLGWRHGVLNNSRSTGDQHIE